MPLDELVKKLNRKLQGYYRYYGITDNSASLNKFRDCVKRRLYKTLNRRSQRKSFNWEEFYKLSKVYKIQNYKIYVNIFELRQEISYIL
ncbi:group II intron maturase-specific domain-containing protein [Clostridium tepidiprofundi]|uniref:group II intron maturase-specific domain-containing protein n=1 Tax=Clostridium tepidiprofundi TaxID=420412 RepID=UPI00191C5A61